MHVLLVVMVLCFSALPVLAAEKSTVDVVVSLIKVHEKSISKPPHTLLHLQGEGGKPFLLAIKEAENEVVHFGIQSQIVIGAEESDYELDTPCQLRLDDNGADGVVDGYQLNCIAWTPKLKAFIEEHSQRLFDELLLEAEGLLR